jgi:hypothetical protein
VREEIVAFLERIGIPAPVTDLPDPEACFLPGVRLDAGRVLHDPARLRWPGDLLHEAGHLAVLEPALRPRLSGGAELEGVDMLALESAAMSWSYAAALHIGIDPAAVFHAGGYRGRGPQLLAQLRLGVAPGLHVLERGGMTSRLAGSDGIAFPQMRAWLAGG